MSVAAEVCPDKRVAIIRFSNPPVNALSKKLCTRLKEAVASAQQDASIRAILLMSGEGLPFSGGADIKEFDNPPSRDNAEVGPLSLLIEEIESATVPTVACIHKYAFGGGLEVALACHYRVSMPTALLGLPEVKLGLIPGAGGTQRLPRLVGWEAAVRMVLTGDPLPSTEAHDIGLVDAVAKGGKEAGAALQEVALTVVNDPKTGCHRRAINFPVPSNALNPLETCQTFAKKAGIKVEASDRGGEAFQGALEALAAAALPDPRRGLDLEARVFNRLLRSEQSKARRYVFFSERRVASDHHLGLRGDESLVEIRHVGVVGGGTMGAGIAIAFLDAGARVTLVEVTTEALARAHEVVQGIVASRVRRGLMSAAQAAVWASQRRFQGTLSLGDLSETDLVVEAVFEDMALKKDIFRRLDAQCRPSTILATNTSTLSIDDIAAVTRRPDRVLGMHFFSPAHMMRLVEVVRGQASSTAVVGALAAVIKRMKKVCVAVGNCDGFVGNRMLFSYQKELQLMVEEGADPYRIDKLLFDFGFPVGPFVMSDIAGLDVARRIKQQRQQRKLKESSTGRGNLSSERDSDVADKLSESSGRLGQKNGRGWYRYDPAIGKGRTPLPDPSVQTFLENFRRSKGLTPRNPPHTDKEILERSIFPLLNEGIKIIEEGIAKSGSDVDIVWIYGYGFPAWRGGPMYYAEHHVGLANLLAGLNKYAQKYPCCSHFRPAGLLQDLVRKGQGLVARL